MFFFSFTVNNWTEKRDSDQFYQIALVKNIRQSHVWFVFFRTETVFFSSQELRGTQSDMRLSAALLLPYCVTVL